MDKKELIILGILAVIAAVAIWFMYFSPVEASSDYSMINIIGDGTIGENGTVYAKLANGENVALKDKEVHITVKDSNGSVVFEDSSKTYVNGVVNFKLTNVSAGKYDVNITFDGDENFTSCSVSEKLKIEAGEVEEDVPDEIVSSVETADTSTQDTSSSQSSYSSQSYRQSYSSDSYSSSDDVGSEDNYYDENGNEITPTYDENGNEVVDE
jgi:hypothetical protein